MKDNKRSQWFDIGVERDHIDSLTKVSGITALAELIWNSLDADATEVSIAINLGLTGNNIIISDNGNGITYEKAVEAFKRIGGSEKKNLLTSVTGRHLHGKEGKGRYRSLALGDRVIFYSTYFENGKTYSFNITIDRNNLTRTSISNLREEDNNAKTGFMVKIEDLNENNTSDILEQDKIQELENKFITYWIKYPVFNVTINGIKLDFESFIKNSEEKIYIKYSGDEDIKFVFKIIEWNFDIKKKTYLSNTAGIPYIETNLGVRSYLPLSLFIQSDYFEQKHINNTLQLHESDDIVIDAIKNGKSFIREYLRKRMHDSSKEFIADLKDKGIYPYEHPAENTIDVAVRQVFDIVALNIHEYMPTFDDQDDKSKKLTLKLVKEALENDSNNFHKILNEVINLPDSKREELAELLDTTSLSKIIDTMNEIKNRLNFLVGLENIIYNPDLNSIIKERKHLHKILIKETWIFGDEYTYGVDDVSLKNVLKAYLKDCLGRDDYEEIVDLEDNLELNKIPDVCLWQQYHRGNSGFENLVIELKKPILDAGYEEKNQIESYATRVANDNRFSKEKTKWKFILVTKGIKKEIESLLHQKNRKYGHIIEGDNFDVFIFTWGDIITEARLRLNFIKEKLGLNLIDNESGLAYIKGKYQEYLPEELK